MQQTPALATELTPAALRTALASLAAAKTEEDCAVALVTAATLMQDAVAANQDAESFLDALESVEGEPGCEYLSDVMNRAIDFHLQEDGSTLGFWLVPVLLKDGQPRDSILSLKTNNLQALRLAGDLMKQMKVTETEIKGWVTVLPKLINIACLRDADIGALINFPLQAQRTVQGEKVPMVLGLNASIEAEGDLYYMPIVVKHPAGANITPPTLDEQVGFRLTKWVTESLEVPESAVGAIALPEPFSEAMGHADRYEDKTRIKNAVETVCSQVGLPAKALTAFIGVYQLNHGNFRFQPLLGLTLVSQLTGTAVATETLECEGSAEDMLADAHAVLHMLGVGKIVKADMAVPTSCCQHCGEIQLALPVPSLDGALPPEQQMH